MVKGLNMYIVLEFGQRAKRKVLDFAEEEGNKV